MTGHLREFYVSVRVTQAGQGKWPALGQRGHGWDGPAWWSPGLQPMYGPLCESERVPESIYRAVLLLFIAPLASREAESYGQAALSSPP